MLAATTRTKELTMQQNVGSAEKTVRIIAGLAVLSLVFFLEGNARWWGLIGLLPLVTGLSGFCPAYTLLGISTAKK
jgi:hypothetical protein